MTRRHATSTVSFKLRVLNMAWLFVSVWACLSGQLPQRPCGCSLSCLQHVSAPQAATQDVSQQGTGPKQRCYSLTAF